MGQHVIAPLCSSASFRNKGRKEVGEFNTWLGFKSHCTDGYQLWSDWSVVFPPAFYQGLTR